MPTKINIIKTDIGISEVENAAKILINAGVDDDDVDFVLRNIGRIMLGADLRPLL